MERLKWRWSQGPGTRLLIVFAVALPVLVLLTGCLASAGLIAYIITYHH